MCKMWLNLNFHSPWVSLLGAILCIAVMFLIQWYTALATFIIVGVLYFYISYRKPEANWGSSTQVKHTSPPKSPLYFACSHASNTER